jgi:hypothetical protein
MQILLLCLYNIKLYLFIGNIIIHGNHNYMICNFQVQFYHFIRIVFPQFGGTSASASHYLFQMNCSHIRLLS